MKPEGNGYTILVGEDEPEVRGYLEMSLKCLGYSVEFAQDGDEVLSSLQALRPGVDVVMLDVIMPNRDGLDTLREIRLMDPDLPVIIITGGGYSPANVVNAMKCGATDFLCKPVAHEDLKRAVEKAIEGRVATPLASTSEPATTRNTGFVGTAPRMREIQVFVKRVGWCEAPVLVQGETGSGKEVLARELHALSPRAHKPFIKLNCAAVPSELLESELFGYERGAFTGAFQKKTGMFELANGGTMLLDEIGDMEVRLQAKLLQVLQDQEFQRIGGKETIRVDVRIIAATHQDLEKAIIDKRFREDLYYRLQVINLVIPPLRDRQEDILPMAEFLWKKHGGPGPLQMTLNLKRVFATYRWPGNVRELENTIRKLIVLRDPELIARDLEAKSARAELAVIPKTGGLSPAAPAKLQPLSAPILEQVTQAKQQAEVEAILGALNASRWNRKQAAKMLKIDYKALLYKMKKLGLDEKGVSNDSEVVPERARAANSGTD
jgi:two-component system response regulator AtoC